MLVLYMSPDLTSERQLLRIFERRPEMRARFRIMEPSLILGAIGDKLRSKDVAAAVNKLHDKHRHLSAKETLTATQAFALGCFCVALPVLLVLAFWETLLAIHVLATFAFALATTIRLAAFVHLWKKKPVVDYPDEPLGPFPTYSILVALHKEAAVASQIVRSMSRLDWPVSRLEVFYVCEEGDSQTLDALARIRMPPSHNIIKVPAAAPMTKPKALNFALERCNGDFVVIYDAEDRPHPQQLRQAWSKFRQAGEDLACLQAPLLVTNMHQGWLPRMFAFEYASHFYGLLPYLAHQGTPLPLGGTSNHFRRDALEKVMAWDPYNVTEDADLGIRFYRFGYRCSVINLPTLEDAPTSLKQWIPQRTRWIKGWIQTLLVHNRRNIRFLNQIGKYNFLLFQILMIGFVFSPLLYGISLIEFSFLIAVEYEYSSSQKIILILDCIVFVVGHIAHILLSTLAWRRAQNQSATIGMCVSLPAYWVLGTFAAWRAVWKLIRAPFEWEKTDHSPVLRLRNPEIES
ncbi:MAG: glycosyltransferase [Rhizobiaceae bacterium]